MAWTLVQSTMALGTSTATFGATPTVGNLIVVAVAQYNAHGTCSDNQGNTYTEDATLSNAPSRSTMFSTIAATSSGTFTVTIGTPGSFIGIVIMEFTGNASSSPVDGTGTYSGSSSAPATGSVTCSQANSMIVALFSSGGSFTTPSVGSNYTQAQVNTNNAYCVLLAEYDLTVSSAQIADMSLVNSPTASGVAVCYKPAAAGGVTAHNLTLLGVGG